MAHDINIEVLEGMIDDIMTRNIACISKILIAKRRARIYKQKSYYNVYLEKYYTICIYKKYTINYKCSH